MPFDGFFTHSIVHELSYLIDARIDKIHQPTKDEVYLFFKKDRKLHRILLCVNSSYPRVQLSECVRENPIVAPNFCMILRKHLGSARLLSVSQLDFDRIIEFKFECRDELGYVQTLTLTAEIMGKHSNVLLIGPSGTIIDCIKHIGCDVNRYRELLPGVTYILPPNSGKINPLMIEKVDFERIFTEADNPMSTSEKLLLDRLLGFSKLMSREICGDFAGMKASELSAESIHTISSRFYYYMARIKSHTYDRNIYLKDGLVHDYHVFPISAYSELQAEPRLSSSQILDEFYGQKGLKDSLKQKFNDIFKLVSNLIERNAKKMQLHRDKLAECGTYGVWKVYGDILMANQYFIGENLTEVELDNFYDENFAKITIPLDPDLTTLGNAQRYYKKYTKEKTTVEMVEKQLIEGENEQHYLESISTNLEIATDVDTIEEIRRELVDSGYIKKRKLPSKQQKSKPHHYRTSDGFDVYVGKNNVQNDLLTLKFADSNDIWMHTKNIPGSHVIVKQKGGTPPSDTALLEGALLAAYYSKARNSTGVPVDYTEKKNVKKPNGAKPGMVIYLTNRTIYVSPGEEKLAVLQKLQ